MEALQLRKKFPELGDGINGILGDFNKMDLDGKGYIDKDTAIKALTAHNEGSYDEVRQVWREVVTNTTSGVDSRDYVEIVHKLRQGQSKGAFNVEKSKITVTGTGSSSGTTHTINEDERTEFTRHINSVLAGDQDIGSRLPLPTDTMQIFDECKDGLVLSKLINDAVADTIDERVLNKPKNKKMNQFTNTENGNIVINSAKGIGCTIVNIRAQDIIDGREHLILGLIWQIIRRGLLSKIDIKIHPELYRLLEDDETLEQFLRLPPEQILLRWFNFHLKAANWERRVNNFSKDVSDAENYTVLLAQIAPQECTRGPLQTRDLLQRAEQVLQNADKLGCRKYLTPTAIVAGNPKLNLAFVAHLFNTHPGLEPLEEGEKPEIEDFDAEGEREARVFTLWLNSLDVDPSVHDLYRDLSDGIILLQAYDKVIPNSVNWKHVNKRPSSGSDMSRFKAVENTNYAVELGKQNHFSLVGIQGADITDEQRTLTLGLVWQLMRTNIVRTLASLNGTGKPPSDSDMLRWANDTVKKGGKSSSVRSFRDPSLGSGVFLLDVLNGVKSGYVDYDLVTPGRSSEDAQIVDLNRAETRSDNLPRPRRHLQCTKQADCYVYWVAHGDSMASSDVNRELEGDVVNLRTELKRLQETYRQEVGDIQTRLEELRALREEPVPLNYVSIQQYEKLMEAYDCEKAEFAKMRERYMREKTEWAKWQQWFYDHGVKTVSTPRSKHSQVKTPVKDRTAARANTQTPRKLEDSPTPRKSQNTQYADTVIGSQSPQLWRTVKREPMSSPLQMHAVGDAYDSLDLDDISETLQQKMDPPLEQIAEEGSCEVSVKSDQHVPKIESPSSSEVFPSQPSPSKPVKGVEVTLPSRNVVIDAAANDGLNYAYEEVVRGHKRKQMHAEDCPCCSKFYTMAAGAGLVQGSTRITPMQMKQQHSRHRYHFKRQQTPPGFWNADFPTTQEEQEYRRQGLEMQRRAHEEKAAIARQGGGRYKFSK